MKRSGNVLTVVVGVSTLCLAYVFWSQSGRGAAVAGDPAAPLPPEDEPDVLFSAPGVTEPKSRTIQIFSEVAGTIRAVHVSAGDRVVKDQVLAEISNDIQKANVDLARAVLERAQADLTRLRNGARPQERAIAKAQVDETEAALRMAEFEWQRVQKMTKQNATSAKEVADAQHTLSLTRARFDAARKRWELSEAPPRTEDVARAEAAVREARAQLATAGSVLEKTHIRSPIDGIVLYRFREPGEAVFIDKPVPILTVGDRSRLHVRVDVDELDIARVSVGQHVYATAPAFDGRRFTGRVVHIEPTLGPKNFRTNRPTEKLDTRIQEVVVALDNADEVPIELQMVVWFLRSSKSPTTHAAGA